MNYKNFKNLKIKKNIQSKNTISEGITTVHGTNHSSLKNRVTSKLWMMLMVLNLLAMMGFLIVAKKRFNSDQIVTQIFSDTKVNEIPFPAVSICNYNLISMRETQYIKRLLINNKIPEKLINAFFKDLALLKSYRVRTSASSNNYSSIMRILKHHYYNVQTMMEELAQKCDNLLVDCEFNGMKKECSDIFNLIQTYQGFCCAFNYAALNDDIDNPLQKDDDDFEYYYDRSNDEKTRIITTAQSGRTSGLKVVFNVEPDQYPPWMPFVYGARILISDPNDFPEVTVRYKHVSMGQALTVKVEPLIFTSDDTLRKIPPKKRGCYFHDEVLLEYTDRYSYETCNTECRMMNFLQLCGCLPYKYPADKNTRFCEISDMPCLTELLAHWSSYKLPCEPECFLECSDKSYSVSADTVPFYYDVPYENTSHLSSLQVYFMKPTCNTYKQSMLIDTVYFIATYGGIFSLSFGGSLLTLFEISYLILLVIIKIINDVIKKEKSEINRR